MPVPVKMLGLPTSTAPRCSAPVSPQTSPRSVGDLQIHLFINFIHGFLQGQESQRPVLQSDLGAGSREIFILRPMA